MRALTILLLMIPLTARPEEALVAVAANFVPALEEIRGDFETSTPHSLRIASGSTGKLYAQIVNGAPFDVFLAADAERPRRLEASGRGVQGTRFTYATGRLVAWSPRAELIADDLATTLRQDTLRRVSMANPRLAPYGAAAEQAIAASGLADALAGRVVLAENVAQAFTMVATGNTDIAIVALSTVLANDAGSGGRFMEISPSVHDPIRQDALLLAHGQTNDAALAFMRYLRSDTVRRRLASLGYLAE